MNDARPEILLASIGNPAFNTVQDDAVEKLLLERHRQRVAHVLGDAEMLTRSFHIRLVELSRGRITSSSPEALQGRFSAYLGSVRFLEWEDVRPPRLALSPDSQWAEVLVQKRVRTIPADTLVTKQQQHALFAWLERWVHTDSVWRLATIASTDVRGEDTVASSLADQTRAYEILRRARAALGGEAVVARVATLRFTAECEGPSGSFRTIVASARDGRVSFTQVFPERPRFAAGISLSGAWQQRGSDAPLDSLGAMLRTVVSGHEMHLLAIGPEARFTAPTTRPMETVDERAVHVVRFHDALSAPADFLYDAATGRPLGFRLVNHTGHGASLVSTRFGDWRPVGDVLLPFAIAITHGRDVYRYRITGATTAWLADRAFQPPSPMQQGAPPESP